MLAAIMVKQNGHWNTPFSASSGKGGIRGRPESAMDVASDVWDPPLSECASSSNTPMPRSPPCVAFICCGMDEATVLLALLVKAPSESSPWESFLWCNSRYLKYCRR